MLRDLSLSAPDLPRSLHAMLRHFLSKDAQLLGDFYSAAKAPVLLQITSTYMTYSIASKLVMKVVCMLG